MSELEEIISPFDLDVIQIEQYLEHHLNMHNQVKQNLLITVEQARLSFKKKS